MTTPEARAPAREAAKLTQRWRRPRDPSQKRRQPPPPALARGLPQRPVPQAVAHEGHADPAVLCGLDRPRGQPHHAAQAGLRGPMGQEGQCRRHRRSLQAALGHQEGLQAHAGQEARQCLEGREGLEGPLRRTPPALGLPGPEDQSASSTREHGCRQSVEVPCGPSSLQRRPEGAAPPRSPSAR